MEKPSLASVAVITLAVTCLATTPPAQSEDRIKQESSPDYSYVYEIKDDSGEGYGKTESRSGEQANGQYYVNSDQATASVKYTADEWGYHPFIKYAAALGPGTSSSTHFILGETALKNFRVYEPETVLHETRAHQIIQPYSVATGDAPLNDKSNLNSNSSIARVLEPDHDINYAKFAQQAAREETPDGNSQGEASSIHAEGVLSNNISEDQLVVETAGNFGQRVDEIDATNPRAHREQKSVAEKQEEFKQENISTFAKPIVVADVDEPANIYSEEGTSSTSPDPEALPVVSNRVSLDDSNDLTTSALVLNPIQAGVSLVNAGKTHLIDTNFTAKLPAPVVERIEDDHADYLEYDSSAYESIQNKVSNNNVEIQKSVEMYHPMPSQEIHYPPQMPQIERLEYPEVEETWNSQRINVRKPSEADFEDRDGFRTSGSDRHEYTSLKQNDESENSYLYSQKDGKVGYEVEIAPSKVYQLVDYKVQHQDQYSNLKYQQQPIYNQYPLSFEKPSEKKVPYVPEKEVPLVNAYFPYRIPVEKVVEKPVPVPQPIPVTVEKIIEKKIPVPVQKIVPQPYPVHVPVPQPVPVPIPVEKIVEKKIPIPQPYPVEVEKIIEKKVPVPVEVTKVVEKPIAVNIKGVPYNFPFMMGYQGLRNHDPFSHQMPAVSPTPSIYVTIPNNQSHMPFQSFHFGAHKNNMNQNNYQNNYHNNNQNIQNYQNIQNQYSHVNPMIGHTKKVPVYYTVPSNLLTYTLLNAGPRRKPMKEIYIGPVPPEPKQSMNIKIQRKAPGQSMPIPMTTLPTRPPMQVTVSYRKARQDSAFPNTGNFRQSKIEYGFKPPMVPSVQYDEETGSKVEGR